MMRSSRILSTFTLLFVLFLVAGPVISQYYDVTSVNLESTFSSPSFNHLVGTDELGRDTFLRVIVGTSLSLRISLFAWITSFFIGLFAGAIAGFFPKSVYDTVISGLISFAYATPFMVFLISFLGVIGPGIENAYFTLILFAWAAPARQTKVIVEDLKDAQYLIAAQSFGYSSYKLLTYVIVPQIMKPVLIASLATLPEIIALDAGLSFFGLGVQPPAPSLGKMIADGINYISIAWWMSFVPVLVLLIVCLLTRYLSNNLNRYIYG